MTDIAKHKTVREWELVQVEETRINLLVAGNTIRVDYVLENLSISISWEVSWRHFVLL